MGLIATNCPAPRCAGGSMFVDVLRFLDLALFGIIAGAAVWVLVTYYRSYKHAPAGRRGLLPAHVALISASYLVSLGKNVAANLERLGHAFTWHIVANAFIFITGLIALMLVLGYEKKVVGIRRHVRVEEDFILDTGIPEEVAPKRRMRRWDDRKPAL